MPANLWDNPHTSCPTGPLLGLLLPAFYPPQDYHYRLMPAAAFPWDY